KGDVGVRGLEGKVDGGRGRVTHGDNGGAMKVDDTSRASGVREKDSGVVGSEAIAEGIGGIGGKETTDV
ncbi:hypothetical protein KI387_026818, partial [Taxus chinensis]